MKKLVSYLTLALFCVVTSLPFVESKAPNKGNRQTGNDCFFNATLEALFHIKPFRNFLDKAQKKEWYLDTSIPNKVIKYLNTMAKNKTINDSAKLRAAVAHDQEAPDNIKAMKRGQHDAQELFSYILEAFTTKARSKHKNTIEHELEKIFAFDIKQVVLAPEMTLEKDRESARNDKYWMLQLYPNERNITLDALIKEYFTDEFIEKKDEQTNRMCPATKKLSIEKLPEVLVLQIVRFAGGMNNKDLSHVAFPLKDLNLTDYLDTSNQIEKKNLYDLVAIIEHGGDTGVGHYWAQGKWKNQWYNYNDSNVRELSDNDIQDIAKQKMEKGNPYMLVYVRNDLMMNSVSLESKEEEQQEFFNEKPHSKKTRKNIEQQEKPSQISSTDLNKLIKQLPIVPTQNPENKLLKKQLEAQFQEIELEQERLKEMLATAMDRLKKIEDKTETPVPEQQEIRTSLETVQNLLAALKQKLVKLTEELRNLQLK